MDKRKQIEEILQNDYGCFDEFTVNKICDVLGFIGRLSFKEIEMLVQLNHHDDSDYGNDEKRCAELIEATRNKVGYTKDDVESYL